MQTLFDTASNLTGGIVTDLTTLFVAVISLFCIYIGYTLLVAALSSAFSDSFDADKKKSDKQSNSIYDSGRPGTQL